MSFSFKEWYVLNAERLNAQRKQRYQTDETYRKHVLAVNQESRKRRKRARTAERRAKKIARTQTADRFKVIEREIDGVTMRLFTIGALAKELGCSIQAIRLWEKQGIIPATPLRSGKGLQGDRLYTSELTKQIREILQAQGRLQHVRSKPKSPRPLTRFIQVGKRRRKISLYLIGVLAEQVNRNVVTLEQLEAKGFLPATPFRTSSVGRRLYSMEMIQVVKKAFRAYGDELRGEEMWQAFHDDILKQWTALGVMGAVLIEEAPNRKRVVSHGTGEERVGTG